MHFHVLHYGRDIVFYAVLLDEAVKLYYNLFLCHVALFDAIGLKVCSIYNNSIIILLLGCHLIKARIHIFAFKSLVST